MISSSRLGLLVLLLVTVSGVAAQQTSIDTYDVYESDPLLYNGKLYTFYLPVNTGGTQFLLTRQFEVGSVTLRGVTYTNLMINYDIYNQQLILKIKFKTGVINQIIVSDAWLEKFSFSGLNFEIISNQSIQKRIFQVLGNGPIRILYYWKKDLELVSFLNPTNQVFSVAVKEMNLFKDNQIMKYRNNRSFYGLFDPEKKIIIKEYLRRHKINVKKANAQSITELISYCNTL